MAQPTISGLPQNIFLSSAALLVNGVDVGLISGVKISVKELNTPVNTDQLGKMVANHFHVGDEATGECEFDEFTASKMKVAFPQATFLVSGGSARLSFGKPVGSDYRSKAAKFEIIPTSDDVAYYGRRFTFHLGVFMGEASVDYGPGKKLTFKSKMHFYPDVTQPNGLWLGYFGDNAAGTLVHASAAAAVAGVGNVGNGTVGSIIVSDSFTKSETWTLTCITHVVGGGLFSVAGSVTGARGVATVGSAFHSNSLTPGNSEIGLTISAGGTDFAVGDSFTIATTAANFT